MSTEHQSVLAQMAKLQGTIDECKKNLGSTATPNSTSKAIPSSSLGLTPNAASYYSRVNSALPVVTKTTWKKAPAPNRLSSHPSVRPQTSRSTKLVLNRPAPVAAQTAPPSNPIALPTTTTTTTPATPPLTTTHHALSVSAQPFHPSTQSSAILITQPVTNSRELSPAHPLQATSLAPLTAPNLTPSPITQTTSNLSNLSIAPNPSPALSAPTPAAVRTNELVINGVSFVRDTQGKKLVRKTDLPAQSKNASASTNTTTTTLQTNTTQKPTPIKALISGMTYVRTKSGNLVELSALKKFQSQRAQEIKRAKLLAAVNAMTGKYTSNGCRSYSNAWDPKKLVAQPRHHKLPAKVSRPPLIKKNEQCRFFAKTGACRNGLTCVYQHDPLQVAICARFLRNKCSYSANSCPLSHKPNPHNMEHCSHFPRCNKADCPYPHIKPTSSQICQEFADLGWCSKGTACTERHVRECPEFSTKGTCSNPACRLRHMINRNNKNDNEDGQQEDDHPTADEAATSDEDGHQGGGLFFTDLTGTDHKGKRKATQQPSGNRSSQSVPESSNSQRTFKGISHNTEVSPAVKRVKYDQMADNSDFVMFISSDEEGGRNPKDDDRSGVDDDTSSEEDELADDPSSLDSEELDSVMTDDHAAAIREDHGLVEVQPLLPIVHPLPPRPPAPFSPHLPAPPVFIPNIVKPRKRSTLEPGEEIEEGEIFDDDEVGSSSATPVPHPSAAPPSAVGEECCSSSDEDELIARQLLGGNHLRF